jgi:hypothetical protein
MRVVEVIVMDKKGNQLGTVPGKMVINEGTVNLQWSHEGYPEGYYFSAHVLEGRGPVAMGVEVEDVSDSSLD